MILAETRVLATWWRRDRSAVHLYHGEHFIRFL
jgi:hypothetical protein